MFFVLSEGFLYLTLQVTDTLVLNLMK
jgi:hypothetical protein